MQSSVIVSLQEQLPTCLVESRWRTRRVLGGKGDNQLLSSVGRERGTADRTVIPIVPITSRQRQPEKVSQRRPGAPKRGNSHSPFANIMEQTSPDQLQVIRRMGGQLASRLEPVALVGHLLGPIERRLIDPQPGGNLFLLERTETFGGEDLKETFGEVAGPCNRLLRLRLAVDTSRRRRPKLESVGTDLLATHFAGAIGPFGHLD